jgi:NAD(P)-dependent dehydrogenase (short-subunit alcohol dehydrogenase family)
MNRKLAGKIALITAGSRGIGAAIARALAEEGADATVAFFASQGAAFITGASIDVDGGHNA